MKSRTWAVGAIALVSPIAMAASASATQNHTDPCPGQHVQVYNENSFVEIAHFVCGAPGTKGDPGKDGVDGKDGKDGAAGPKGDVGATGPTGSNGVGTPGLQGPAGPAGPAGEAGLPGSPGADGKAGVDGSAGVAGPTGPRGADGSFTRVSITSEEATKEQCPTGGRAFYAIVIEGDIEDLGVVCNGQATSSTGVRGLPGKDGKDGVSKTVYIVQKPDGTKEVVDALPHTGSDSHTLLLAIAGAVAVAAGIGVYTAGRRK